MGSTPSLESLYKKAVERVPSEKTFVCVSYGDPYYDYVGNRVILSRSYRRGRLYCVLCKNELYESAMFVIFDSNFVCLACFMKDRMVFLLNHCLLCKEVVGKFLLEVITIIEPTLYSHITESMVRPIWFMEEKGIKVLNPFHFLYPTIPHDIMRLCNTPFSNFPVGMGCEFASSSPQSNIPKVLYSIYILYEKRKTCVVFEINGRVEHVLPIDNFHTFIAYMDKIIRVTMYEKIQ
jgi:hypothetical protein